MKLEDFLTALRTPLRVRICQVLGGEDLSLQEILERYERKFGQKRNRETVYRALEDLVERGLVDKQYDKKGKRICYSMRIRRALVDFDSDVLLDDDE